jgi:AICAR transformylase/IMP cyclohydrolase PurH
MSKLFSNGVLKAIVNPGGSVKDANVIKHADEFNVALIICGKHVFRH